MESEGNISLTPLSHVLHGACFRAPANPSINVHNAPGAVPGLCQRHKAAAERDLEAAMTGTAPGSLSPARDSPAPRTLHTSSSHTPCLFFLSFLGTVDHSGVSFPLFNRGVYPCQLPFDN